MTVGEKKETAIALDISEGGMGLLINYDIPVSAIVMLKFAMINVAAPRIEDQYRSMELEGEVRYSFYIEEKYAYRVGISFVNISNDERKFIAHFVETISSR
jgi:c-di-GMP-binding flagellar brake protein YcgR